MGFFEGRAKWPAFKWFTRPSAMSSDCMRSGGIEENTETGNRVRGQGHDKMTMRRVAGIGEMEGKGKQGKTGKGNRVGGEGKG